MYTFYTYKKLRGGVKFGKNVDNYEQVYRINNNSFHVLKFKIRRIFESHRIF